jgi:hypothetical protein
MAQKYMKQHLLGKQLSAKDELLVISTHKLYHLTKEMTEKMWPNCLLREMN